METALTIQESLKTRAVGHKDRPIKRLLSHPFSYKIQEILQGGPIRRSTTIHGHAHRVKYSSSHLHQGSFGTSQGGMKKGHTHSLQFIRLDCETHQQLATQDSLSINSQSHSETGMGHKLPQINPRAYSEFNI